MNYIKRTFDRGNDIAETLRTLTIQEEDKGMLTQKMSNLQDQAIISRKNKQFELEYKAMLDEVIKRVAKYDQNLFKTYTFLWVTVAMLYRRKL